MKTKIVIAVLACLCLTACADLLGHSYHPNASYRGGDISGATAYCRAHVNNFLGLGGDLWGQCMSGQGWDRD